MKENISDYIEANANMDDVFQSQQVAINLAKIWRKLFDDKDLKFSYDEDFFVLGASSLLSVNLVNEIVEEFKISFSLTQLLSATQFNLLTNLINELQNREKITSDASINPDDSNEDMDIVII